MRQAVLAIVLAGTGAGVLAQSTWPPASLKEVFDAAWVRQPESQALLGRREAVQAERRAAQAWTPEPPALELSHKTDRLTRNDGAREFELGVAVPLWLPGERRHNSALADAEAAAIESRVEAARLRLAATVREAWWNWQRARIDADVARGQLDNARRIASDVARRAKAGELARADQHQADGASAAAEAGVAQADAESVTALLRLRALTGGATVAANTNANANAGVDVPTEAEPSSAEAPVHPALTELQDRAKVAERTAALAATRSRANPELTLAATRDRGGAGERYGHTVSVGIRIPFGAGPRYDSRVAAARADAVEAQVQLELDQVRLQSERESAVARVGAARAQLAAAERRATLARETRGFFEKSFRLGESDLPTRLRIENEANEAERQAARGRIELAAAISLWRQALGLLPQ
ncbi:TolC family protein [Ottowia thiooxydans]|uniref:TolC family protein n=1 Tax=Ottowia thiooxydans TaxID=219182 RepID=UPI000416156D|nr:TolC family protein [Ottowia thiooxydans]